MTQKTITISSTEALEEEKERFMEETGQSKSEIYRRAHILYFANERRKKKPEVKNHE